MANELSKLERETIILFNEEEPCAEIATMRKPLIRRLNKLLKDHEEEMTKREKGECAMYTVPKKWIKISPPPKRRPLSDAQKEEIADRLKRARNQ